MNASLTPVVQARLLARDNRIKSPATIFPLMGLFVFLVLPLFGPSYFTIDLAVKVLIFGVFAATFDVMLGYTGVLSFGHSMFFGFGAYSCAMLFREIPDSPVLAIALAFVIAAVISAIVASLMAFFSLRVVAIFFAMITLAFASFTEILAIQLSSVTGGEDGITMQLPYFFDLSYELTGSLTGQTLLYYFILVICVLMFSLMLRFTNSPFGRVLKSIRENEDRSEALGYKTFYFRLFSIVFSCILASFCGILFALWLSFVSPESTLGIPITLNVLIMVLIGGMGTLYGGIIGSFILQLLEGGLPQLRIIADEQFPQYPWLGDITGRWLLLFGLLFVLIVFFFPSGIIGWLKQRFQKSPT
ncbi:branched-chain amino acid ABC transporter permease [bacterium]|nr:branched-chain amino acid ABC transporter permease [bacterium]